MVAVERSTLSDRPPAACTSDRWHALARIAAIIEVAAAYREPYSRSAIFKPEIEALLPRTFPGDYGRDMITAIILAAAVAVIDGDTIRAGDGRIRLLGIDAAEFMAAGKKRVRALRWTSELAQPSVNDGGASQRSTRWAGPLRADARSGLPAGRIKTINA